MQDQFTTTTGSFTVTCKTGSNNWAGTLVAFKQAPTGTVKVVHRVTSN